MQRRRRAGSTPARHGALGSSRSAHHRRIRSPCRGRPTPARSPAPAPGVVLRGPHTEETHGDPRSVPGIGDLTWKSADPMHRDDPAGRGIDFELDGTKKPDETDRLARTTLPAHDGDGCDVSTSPITAARPRRCGLVPQQGAPFQRHQEPGCSPYRKRRVPTPALRAHIGDCWMAMIPRGRRGSRPPSRGVPAVAGAFQRPGRYRSRSPQPSCSMHARHRNDAAPMRRRMPPRQGVRARREGAEEAALRGLRRLDGDG